MPMKKVLLGAAVVLGLAANPADAATVSYDIGWTGAGGYSLAGLFSFDDATAGTTVEASELINFSIEGFLGAASLGTFIGTPANFNFNALAGTFLIGGDLASSTGQQWNVFPTPVSGIGFTSGPAGQLLVLNGWAYSESYVFNAQSTLTATLNVSEVPLPAALPLLAAGLGALGVMGRRKRRAAQS